MVAVAGRSWVGLAVEHEVGPEVGPEVGLEEEHQCIVDSDEQVEEAPGIAAEEVALYTVAERQGQRALENSE